MYVLKRRKSDIKHESKWNLKSKGKNANSNNTNELLKNQWHATTSSLYLLERMDIHRIAWKKKFYNCFFLYYT